jgi:UDP-N-acetylmuramate dehydrogenase
MERLPSAGGGIAESGLVRAGAGVSLKRLAARCAAWGLSGLEGLTGIPGTVGGAVAMNAGSFGTETARLLHGLLVWTPETGVATLRPGDWTFAYRHFALTRKKVYFFILAAIFHLTKSQSGVIRNSMTLNFFQKKSTQPLSSWSAGCAFKNPPAGPAAGKLLEEAGFKGKRLGGMAFSTVHANFLINEGAGSANAAFELLEEAREAVFRRNGIQLQTEIRILR